MVAINEKRSAASARALPIGGYYLLQDTLYRAVALTNSSGAVIAQYTYNAMGYRITEAYPQGGAGIPAGEVNYIYYNSNWQAIETRTNGTAAGNVASQTVWSAAYINAAVLQDTYSAGTIQPNSRIYFLQDADWNTTAIVGYNGTAGTWGVTQRYVYSPYGTITVLNADWSTTPTGTQPIVSNLYQGMTLDSVTGLYYARDRNYSPSLGRWINQDPAGYINGANTYQFVESSPAGNVDPSGLDAVVLISPGEAHGQGHAAVIIGNDQTGWDYYSKNGRTGPLGLWGGNEGRHEHYKTLGGFFGSRGHGKRYPERMLIPASHARDEAMRKYAGKQVYTPYSLLSSNCANLVEGTLHAGKIPAGNIGFFLGWGPAVPKTLWGNLNHEMGNGQLPPETTTVVPTNPSSVWPMNPAMPLHVVGPAHLTVPFS